MNATMRKFGYPDTLVHESAHWAVLLRPAQATLGACVLACKAPARRFGELPAAAFADLAVVVPALEAALGAAFGHDKLNYLMLMMVDPDVHFHVLPRYAQRREFAGAGFEDPGWPGPPRLDAAAALSPEQLRAVGAHLKAHWPESSAARSG